MVPLFLTYLLITGMLWGLWCVSVYTLFFSLGAGGEWGEMLLIILFTDVGAYLLKFLFFFVYLFHFGSVFLNFHSAFWCRWVL